jgi:ABC-type nitrate/sulfonate/bicarbonate transport systems, periplasmic components
MKRLFALMLVLLLLLFTAAAAEEAQPVRIGALKGPTAMGMVSMMKNKSDAYTFTIGASADELVPMIAQGTLDIAAVPANLAAILSKKTEGGVQVLAINTLGVLYLVERGETISSVEDLRGRTIYSAGKGSSPEYVLNYILRGNGLEPGADVTVEYKSEHAECLAALIADDSAVAMLPQPFATVAMGKADDMRIALDLTEAWDALQTDTKAPSTLITGVVIAHTDFISENPEAVAAFMADYEESVAFTNENTVDAAALIGEFDIFEAAVAEKALPYCKVTFIAGEEMKTLLSGYLSVLFDADSAAVGGALPDDSFYYVG